MFEQNFSKMLTD